MFDWSFFQRHCFQREDPSFWKDKTSTIRPLREMTMFTAVGLPLGRLTVGFSGQWPRLGASGFGLDFAASEKAEL